MRPSWALSGMLLALAGGLLSACGSDRRVNLELDFPVDAPLRYNLSGSLTSAIDPGSGVPSQETTVTKTGLLVLQGLDRDPEGTATVRRTLDGITYRVARGASQTQPDISGNVKFNADGRVMSSEMMAPMSPDPTIGLFLPLLPDHPVQLKDTWQTDYDVPLAIGTGKQHIRCISTLSAVEGPRGARSATIDSQLTIRLDTTVDVRQQAARNRDRLQLPDNYFPTQHTQMTVTGSQTTVVDVAHNRVASAKGQLDVDAGYENTGFPAGVAAHERITGNIRNEVTLAGS